ncbi:hypothetical protein BDD12DRAFT_981835 [Trichophaea hybrida]|nr:hypothetical protein BDD12DRAFT_981835 [Trichophaea hybrida]
MSLVTRSSSSSDRSSFYWSTPDSPLSPNYSNFYSLRCLRGFTLHDGVNEAFRADGTDSPETDDSSAQRRYHVFGTPTSQAGTVDDSASTNSEVEIAYGDVGMDMVRDARGSGIGSRGSEALSGSIRSIRSIRSILRNEDRVDLPLARGGHGKTAWVLLDQPGTVVPEIRSGNTGRRLSAITTSDGTTSQKSIRTHSPENQESIPPSMLHLSTSPLPEVRRSIESKFSEDLPKVRKGSSPILWIKNTVKSRTDIRGIGNNTSERNEKDKNIPRRLQKRLSGIMVLPETTEPSSRSNVNLQVQSSSRLGGAAAQANVSYLGVNSDAPFLDQLDNALSAARPNSKIRKLSSTIMEAGRKFQAVPSPIKKGTQRTSFNGIGHMQLPPRSKSVPPQINMRNSIWDLEFLPSEAQGVKTPTEYPVYDKKHVGGMIMPLSQERRYFGLADMVQSQPPLAPAGEVSTRLDPKDVSMITTCSGSILNSYSESDCHAIAPFIAQDLQRPQSPALTAARSVVSATGKKIRRASVHARNIIMPRKLSDVNETHKTSVSQGSDSGKGDNPTPDAVPGRIRSGRSVVKWIKRASVDSGGFSGTIVRKGQYGSELEIVKPAEVIMEEARREKRDSRVIGLDPDAYSSSTDDSFTYTSALQDIAGLSKRLKGPAAASRTQAPEIGELVTPSPPGYPRNCIAPGSLLQGDLRMRYMCWDSNFSRSQYPQPNPNKRTGLLALKAKNGATNFSTQKHQNTGSKPAVLQTPRGLEVFGITLLSTLHSQ